jgi:hypothetical protein
MIREGVLSAILLNPDHCWFMTELARHLKIPPPVFQRELEALVASGFGPVAESMAARLGHN